MSLMLGTTKIASKNVTGDTLPIGAMLPWTSDTIPENWLLCNGQAISRTTYSLLYAVIGTTYGTGDGSTTFNVPDMRDYVPVGKSSTDANIDALGKKYGAQTHALAETELPYNTVMGNGPSVSNSWATGIWNNYTGAYSTNVRGNLGTSGVAHNNMQKSMATNYIIKAFQSSGVVATVVDNLTSTSATNALSANQGKVLNDNKANLSSPTFTGTVTLPSTTSIGNVSATEIGYLDNVTSAIQTQLNSITDRLTTIEGSMYKIGISVPSNDCNNALSDGCYNYGNTASNSPTASSYGTIFVMVSSGLTGNNTDNWVNQIGITTGNVMKFRQKINSGAWTAWQTISKS